VSSSPGRAGTKKVLIAQYSKNFHEASWNVGILENRNIGFKIGIGLFLNLNGNAIRSK
jgi:hypothetical protein